MVPKLRPYAKEVDNLIFVEDHKDEFMCDLPDPWMDRLGFEEFLGEAKLAWVLKAWMNETTEDEMITTIQTTNQATCTE
jgi:hypothetical protein